MKSPPIIGRKYSGKDSVLVGFRGEYTGVTSIRMGMVKTYHLYQPNGNYAGFALDELTPLVLRKPTPPEGWTEIRPDHWQRGHRYVGLLGKEIFLSSNWWTVEEFRAWARFEKRLAAYRARSGQ